MAIQAQSVARLVDVPLQRGLKINTRTCKITYSPGIVEVIPIIRVDFRAIPNSWAAWREIEPYRIEAEIIIPPDATVSVRKISASVFAPPGEWQLPSMRTIPDHGVEYDNSQAERTIIVNGQDSVEIDTLINDPSAVKILDGHIVGETMGKIKPTVEVPGYIRFPERAYGWLLVRYPRRLAKAWIVLPLFRDYTGFAHTGQPAQHNACIEVNGNRLCARMIPWPNPFIGHKELLALTARGLQKAKSPTWTFSFGSVTPIVQVDLSADIDTMLGTDWQSRPLIDPVTFELSVSAPGRATQTIQCVAPLPEPDVGFGDIWLMTINVTSGNRLRRDVVGMPKKIAERLRDAEETEIPLTDKFGDALPLKIKVKRTKKIVFEYHPDDDSNDKQTLDMELLS